MEKYGLKCEWTVYYIIHDETNYRTIGHWKLDLMKRKAADTYEFDKYVITDNDADQAKEAPKVDESKLTSLKCAYPGGNPSPPAERVSGRKRKASQKKKEADESEQTVKKARGRPKKIEPKSSESEKQNKCVCGKCQFDKNGKQYQTVSRKSEAECAKKMVDDHDVSPPHSPVSPPSVPAKKPRTEEVLAVEEGRSAAERKIAELEQQIALLRQSLL